MNLILTITGIIKRVMSTSLIKSLRTRLHNHCFWSGWTSRARSPFPCWTCPTSGPYGGVQSRTLSGSGAHSRTSSGLARPWWLDPTCGIYFFLSTIKGLHILSFSSSEISSFSSASSLSASYLHSPTSWNSHQVSGKKHTKYPRLKIDITL